MPWIPRPGHKYPTLGFEAIAWIEEYLAHPDMPDPDDEPYEPFRLYREQAEFILRWYEIDPITGKRKYHRGVFGRSRGWGKSPILGALAILEAIGPCVFDGWDANGQPVAKPWSEIRTPLVHVAAVSETQTANTWTPILGMLRGNAPIHSEYDIEAMNTFVSLPNHGKIEAITANARTVKGARAHFAVLDQTEEWVPSNGGVKLADTMRTNAAKVGGTTLESPNAYFPGQNSVAEQSAVYWEAIRSGTARDEGLLYDHREAPGDTKLDEYDSLYEGLRVAYGDASGDERGCTIHTPACDPGHVNIDRLIRTIWDPTKEEQDSRSDFLNQITHAADSWIPGPVWAACEDLDKIIDDRDTIVLGFDGSMGRTKGKADATALIGCRVNDGHLFEIRVWEQPPGVAGKNWMPNVFEVEQVIAATFEQYRVIGFYADPSHWVQQCANWQAKYGRRLKVKATQSDPIMMWPRGKTANIGPALKQFHDDVSNREMTHDGGASLTRHILNARRRFTRSGYLIYKAYPDSPEKIDAAYAAVLAWKARTDAIADGFGKSEPRQRRVMVL